MTREADTQGAEVERIRKVFFIVVFLKTNMSACGARVSFVEPIKMQTPGKVADRPMSRGVRPTLMQPSLLVQTGLSIWSEGAAPSPYKTHAPIGYPLLISKSKYLAWIFS